MCVCVCLTQFVCARVCVCVCMCVCVCARALAYVPACMCVNPIFLHLSVLVSATVFDPILSLSLSLSLSLHFFLFFLHSFPFFFSCGANHLISAHAVVFGSACWLSSKLLAIQRAKTLNLSLSALHRGRIHEVILTWCLRNDSSTLYTSSCKIHTCHSHQCLRCNPLLNSSSEQAH